MIFIVISASNWQMVQASMTSFFSMNIATAVFLEVTPGMTQVRSLLSVNIATPGSLQVVHRFTPGRYLPANL